MNALMVLAFQAKQGPPAGLFAAFGVVWCMMMLVVPAQFVMALVAMVQVLKRRAPADQKILWAAVVWFVPLVGAILWWTIGTKQVGTPPGPPDYPGER